MAYSNEKIAGLMKRVYNSQMIETEEQNDGVDIREYCEKVFGDGSFNPDPSLLHQFNSLVVKLADEIAKPKVTSLLKLFASTQSRKRDEIVKIEIPQEFKAKVRWSANGSGVDMTRVEGKSYEIAVPRTFSTGFYYEPLDLVTESEQNFRKLINKVADAKVDLYIKEVTKLFDSAIASGKIPANNVLTGSNLTIANYNKVASRLARYGGRPLFVADSLLIDHFAMQQATDSTFKGLLTDKVKEELLTSLNPSTIGRTTAVNLVNPFLDKANSKTELPVNIGYLFAGGVKQKPFSVVEFGGLRQMTEQDIEDERIKVKIYQDADISMIFGEAIGYVKEDTAVVI